jgi:XTP/dITP diphosphohydrolase
MQLIFATQNQNKIQEIQTMLPPNLQLASLKDLNYNEELPETHETLHENALEKARYVAEKFNTNCFAEDTGLEVEALNGAPGVYSARYAGEQKNHTDNINLLLKNLQGETNRKARFRTVIALILYGKEHLFEGIVNGIIIETPKGTKGFGYDPIFIADGHTASFAEISIEDKNNISHRARAFSALKTFLHTL